MELLKDVLQQTAAKPLISLKAINPWLRALLLCLSFWSQLMKCFGCGAAISADDKFCASCGKPLRGGRRAHGTHRDERREARPAQSGIGHTAYLDLLVQKKQKSTLRKRAVRAVFLLVSGTLVALFGGNLSGSDFYIPVGIMTVLVLLTFVPYEIWLTEAQYRALPESTNERGEHQCVKCGNRGIHRSTTYQTNSTDAVCSRCRLPLWQE